MQDVPAVLSLLSPRKADIAIDTVDFFGKNHLIATFPAIVTSACPINGGANRG
jgi:hypothetical protein